MKLLVFDVEGTIFRTRIRLPGTSLDSTIWQGLAYALGPHAIDEEIETHRRWERKEYSSYINWMEDTIRIHKKYGLTHKMFYDITHAAEYNTGVPQTFAKLDRNQYVPVMITGGFRELAARPQRDFGILHTFAACEYLFGDNGKLEAYNLLPCDFEGKIDFILLMLREYGLTEQDWVFVGDGKNDVPIAQSCPLSIGYRPHPALREVVTYIVEDFRDLLNILQT
ncbi:HAD family hydrolase [Candidatus Entotheonella palauensis]|uniref:phosphoserine phosphatase n=1 Tax=Candidatus Entotheonella gemina TaxID=1429439 RepID=W4M504_9BACT|nr:HAD family hydrolase [Candidatus Entotheonella palauensis]ETX05263.1 MAG: hypothetical protein ETSY2_24005 [Candidatus Entotheonella gemina]